MLANEPLVLHSNENNLSQSARDVRAALIAAGMETPMVASELSASEKKRIIADKMHSIMQTLGLDLSDDSLMDTPERIAKMYVDEIFAGLDYANFPKITQIENKMKLAQPVTVADISLTSTCEHHFVTIDGTAKIAYIPKKTVIGLSKLNRLIGFFAQRPQVQERLNQQVLIALQTLTGTDDVAVMIDATHYCVKARGVRDSNSYTKTVALGGKFEHNSDLRREFFEYA